MYNRKLFTVITVIFLFFTSNPHKSSEISFQVSDEDIYFKDNEEKASLEDIDLFLPKWTSNSLFHSSSLSEEIKNIYPYLRNGVHARRLFILSKELIEKIEKMKFRQKINEIIQKEINLDISKINKNILTYIYPDIKTAITSSLPHFITSISQIREFELIKDIIKFEPENIVLKEKPMCIPTMALLNLKNISKNKIIIKNVRTDLYQTTIFLFQQAQDKSQSQYFNPKVNYPRELDNNTFLTFQIILLPDTIGEITGNLYIEFELNDEIGVIVYPISINSVDNMYKIAPIYYPSWPTSKLLSLPITILNPHDTPLQIKEVINSFSSINLVWPNGTPVTNRGVGVPASMVTINTDQSKNLMYINYYKEVAGIEYGLIQLKTDKDTLIVPVLVKVENLALQIYPSVFNFGLVQRKNILEKTGEVRAIPIYLTNLLKGEMEIRGIFFKYEDKSIDFVPVTEKYDEEADFCSEKYECTLQGSTRLLLGYITFDSDKVDLSHLDNSTIDEVIQKNGTLFIETNNADNQFIEVEFEYFIDNSTLNGGDFIINAEEKTATFEKEIINLERPYNFGYVYKHLDYSNITNNTKIVNLTDKVQVHLKEIKNHNIEYTLTIEDIPEFIDEYNEKFYYIPLYLNEYYFTLYPIDIYDNMLELYVCNRPNLSFNACYSKGSYGRYKGINLPKRNGEITINLDNISTNHKIRHSVYLENKNKNPVTIEFEKPLSETQMIIQIKSDKKIIEEEEPIIIQPFSKFKFNINVISLSPETFKEKIRIFFENSFLTINLVGNSLDGKLLFSPEKLLVNIRSPKEVELKVKSTYDIPINITGLQYNYDNIKLSPYQRHQYTLKTNETVSIGTIAINPHVIFPMPKINYFKNSYLTYRELYQWKQLQYFSENKALEVNKSLTIQTSLFKTELPIEGNITKLEIISNNYSIDFGDVQIGKSVEQYFTVKNPTSSVLVVQPLLSTKNYLEKNLKFSEKKRKIKNFDEIGEDLSIFNCYFHNSTKSENIFGNYLTMQFEQFINDLKKKTSIEGTMGYDLSNAIIINKNLSFLNNPNIHENLSKKELLELIYKNAKPRIKNTFSISDRILCKIEHITKEDILMKENKDLLEMVFTSEINKEILSIKKLTEKKFEDRKEHFFHNYNTKQNKGLFSSLGSLFNKKKKNSKQSLETQQDLFLASDKSSNWNNIYYIPPRSSMKLGPLIYSPKNFSKISTVLLIKNNLTLITPIPVYGNAGSGIPRIFSTEYPTQEIFDEYIIKISQISKIINKQFTISNEGNFPFTFDGITLSNGKCKKDSFSIVDCTSITIQPNETKTFNFTITPNLHFHTMSETIYFHSESINVIAIKIELQIDKKTLYGFEQFFDIDISNFKIISGILIIIIGLVVLGGVFTELFQSSKMDTTPPHSFNIFEGKKKSVQELKKENLFMKSFRKFNLLFYELVLVKMDEEKISFIIDANRRKKLKTYNKENKDANASNSEDKQNKPKEKEPAVKEGKKNKKKKKKTKKQQKNIVGIAEAETDQKAQDKEVKQSGPTLKGTKTPLSETNSYYFKYNKYEQNSEMMPYKYELAQGDMYAPSYYPKSYYKTSQNQYGYPKYKPFYSKEQSIYGPVPNKPLPINQAIKYEKRPDLVEVPTSPRNEIKKKNNEPEKVETTTNVKDTSSSNIQEDNSLIDNFNAFNNPMFVIPSTEEKVENEPKGNENTTTPKEQVESTEDKPQEKQEEPVAPFNPFKFGDFFDQSQLNANNESMISTEKENKGPLEDYYTSGNEDLNFNFNSMFGVDMKPMNFETDNANENEGGEKVTDSSKPYFEGFNTKMKNKLTYSNPFATSKNHILTDLYESDDDKGEYDDLDLEANKVDEKGEGDLLEEEDDEPEPEWGDEDIDVKKEGYFDETGAYKLKQ